VLHAIAFAPPGCFGAFTGARWEDASTAIRISAYSLSALAASFAPLMGPHGSFVGLDFDATRVWPGYNWMGVSKAALESIARYLAWELGRDQLRVNLVSAGPLKTVASGALGNFQEIASVWDERAPLGWNWKSPEEVARTCVFLLSDWSRGMTGEILHVDGGVHVMGGRT
jgi:enoyl-[acyl-carrier protein] reductase I